LGKHNRCLKARSLFERGQRSVDFFIVLQGNIEIYEHRQTGENVVTVHGEHQFTGEIDLFSITVSDRITLHTQTEITDLQGDRHLEQVTWHDRRTDTTTTQEIRHVFLMIGAVPNTGWLDDCLTLDEKGFICTGIQLLDRQEWTLERHPMVLETSVPGIFAGGDVRSGSVERVASVVGGRSYYHQPSASVFE
jgi:thioredoxin reductase